MFDSIWKLYAQQNMVSAVENWSKKWKLNLKAQKASNI